MDIVRNPDGTLVVPIPPERHHDTGEGANIRPFGAADATRLLHPGEGGYDEALAEWDLQQNPDRAPVVSTATGRQEAMTVVHAVATSPDHAVAPAVAALDDPEAGRKAFRAHVLELQRLAAVVTATAAPTSAPASGATGARPAGTHSTSSRTPRSGRPRTSPAR